MAARRAFLTALLAALVLAGAVVAGAALRRTPGARAAGATPECAGCHPVHYEARGTCTGCHRGSAASTRREIAHAELLRGAAAAWSMTGAAALAEGERLRDRLGCRRCHVTGGTGNRLAISLDAVAWRRSQEQLRRSIREPATFMPDFALTDEQADALIAVLLRDGSRTGAEARYLVRFREGDSARADGFADKCGPCHRALTPLGPVGASASGPNLSGLLTPHYPATDGRPWTAERLEKWVRNPRSERPGASMRPVELTPAELAQVIAVLGDERRR